MVQDMRNGNGEEMATEEFRISDMPVSASPSDVEKMLSAYGTSSKGNQSETVGRFGCW